MYQTEVKKNLLTQVVNSKNHAVCKSTGDFMNVPDTRGRGTQNVWLIDEFDKCMSTTFQQANMELNQIISASILDRIKYVDNRSLTSLWLNEFDYWI